MKKYKTACASLRPGQLDRLTAKVKDRNTTDRKVNRLQSIKITIEITDGEILELYKNASVTTIVNDFLHEHLSSVVHGDEVWAEKIYGY